MLPAVHLLIGITLGIVLLYITHDCRAIIYCALGSLLPDLIDKPLGHIVFFSLGNGRIFFHSLTVCVIVAILGVILFLWRRHPGLLFIAAGMLSHQLADAMWAMPRSWYWPFLGWFHPKYNPNYFHNMFGLEFSSPSELLVIAAGGVLFLCLLQAWRTGNGRFFRGVTVLVGCLLLVTGVLVISGISESLLPGALVYSGTRDILICGLSLFCGGAAFLLVGFSPPIGCTVKDLL